MKRNGTSKEDSAVRVELKYCEHCGGLWVREGGVTTVYCEKCLPKVAELPVPKKKPGRVRLPVGRRTLVGDYETDDSDTPDLEAVGGVA